MINDNYIKELHKGHKSIIKHLEPDVKEYLENRYEDSESIKETIWRILNDIEQRPVCKICGGRVEFIGRKNIIFRRTCGKNCFKKSTSINVIDHFSKLNKEDKEKIVRRRKQTNLEKYGVEHNFQTQESRERSSKWIKSEIFKDKSKKTNLEKYGVENPMQNKEISKQSIKTRKDNGWISPWTTDNPMKRKEVLEKRNKTNQERYGGNSPTNNKEIRDKQFNTKKENSKYTKSKMEDYSYELLRKYFDDVERQYKDKERYPFNCDFYIPSLDLFIECQYFWTHNNHPFDKNNINDINKAQTLLEKNHINAFETWTIRDVKKRETAKQNNLNWIEFFTIEELKQWLQYTYIKP